MNSYFPDRVDEHSARLTAGAVSLLTAGAFLAGFWPLLAVLASGFLARAILGPRASLLSRLSAALARRLWPPKPVAGAPKRFAQAIGAALMLASVAFFASGAPLAGWIAAGAVALCAALESAFAFCVGCQIYGVLQRAGFISLEACPECAGGACPTPNTDRGPSATS
jgi:hypothetical protein